MDGTGYLEVVRCPQPFRRETKIMTDYDVAGIESGYQNIPYKCLRRQVSKTIEPWTEKLVYAKPT
jgi:hypothetical protein